MMKLLFLAVLVCAATQVLSQLAATCPFDCATCNGVTQTCLTCAAGYRLHNGRCNLDQCDHAHAHRGKKTDGSDYDEAEPLSAADQWQIVDADSSTHTVVIAVQVPPRYACPESGHALQDALDWIDWNNATHLPQCTGTTDNDGTNDYCGPAGRWTPVIVLGLAQDTAEGYLKLPSDTQDDCHSATRISASANNLDIDTYFSSGLIQSYNPLTGFALIEINLQDITTDTSSSYCTDKDWNTAAGSPVNSQWQYWSKENDENAGEITYTFDATLCYVDTTGDAAESGEQSTCPFSSPVFKAVINEITDAVAVQAGTVELEPVPDCELILRSAQVRYSGQVGSRSANGDYEIEVRCEGDQYEPEIVGISHCACTAETCTRLDPEEACDLSQAGTCSSVGSWDSLTFSPNPNNLDYLSKDCVAGSQYDDGKFVVEIQLNDGTCVNDAAGCAVITNQKLFGAAPLTATDSEEEIQSFYNSHAAFGAIFKDNDLRARTGAEADYYHQFNRTYVDFATVTRLVGQDQKNSWVVCAMMQPIAWGPGETHSPSEITQQYRVAIREVKLIVDWNDDNGAALAGQTTPTLASVLNIQTRWPSTWVWQSQDAAAQRRQILRREARIDLPCTAGGQCEATDMQDEVYKNSNWDHIQNNFDCVGVSPFYLYQLLTLAPPQAGAYPRAVTANLTVYHQNLGSLAVPPPARRLLSEDRAANGRRKALQAGANSIAPVQLGAGARH
jgi:hypothetical protein